MMMPYVIKRKDKDGFMTCQGHYDASALNAWRFKDKSEADRYVEGKPSLEIVSVNVRLGVDRPCAQHKGPAGDCQPWNCVCF